MPIKRKPVNPSAFQSDTRQVQHSYTEQPAPLNFEKAERNFDAAQPELRADGDDNGTYSSTQALPRNDIDDTISRELEKSLANLDIIEPVSSTRSAFVEDQVFLHDEQGPFVTEPESLEPLNRPETVNDQTFPLEVQSTGSAPPTTTRSRILTALDTTTHYLGSLLPHPTTSTKYYTILRHSHGLVYYRGPSTSLAITIFSSRPLSSDRRLWLQMKGWTGKTGMRAKALLRTNSSWINVTPERQVRADDLVPRDEKAWQRDIRKFLQRAPKASQSHICRETCVVRMPFEAVDGYFRIVLTTADSRSVLCPSPVFRVASTSMSASSVKGASLSTLPIELAVKIAQFAGRTVATNAVAPTLGVVKEQVMGVIPGSQNLTYAQTAYDLSGVQDTVDEVEQRYQDNRGDNLAGAEDGKVVRYEPIPRTVIVGDDRGPEAPFPLRLKGTIAQGSGRATEDFGMPTANLDNIPLDIIAPVKRGAYFGWALVTPKNKAELDLYTDWRPAITTIATQYSERAAVAQRKTVRAYLLHDFPPSTNFVGARLELVLMGWLRPLIPGSDKEAVFAETIRDIEITQASLDRDAWGPQETLQRMATAHSQRSMTDRLVQVRSTGQRQVDRVPVHMLGVRNDSFGLHDRGVYGNGGVFVKRD